MKRFQRMHAGQVLVRTHPDVLVNPMKRENRSDGMYKCCLLELTPHVTYVLIFYK